MTEIFSTLVGVTFRGGDARTIVKSLEIGDQLQLEAEPDNAYDSNAVKVLYDDVHIGYLSRESNAETAEHLANDGAYTCEVASFLSELKPHLQIQLLDDEED